MIFISYSHDNPEHIDRVLQFCNRLRSDGFDCHIDQYEVSPPEGWPRWMDKKIDEAEFVLMICTEPYYKRVTLQEENKGAGVKWEGGLIYQHIYNASSLNSKFIPLILSDKDHKYIPIPLKGASYYTLEECDYEKICRRLMNLPTAEKPLLGQKKPLPPKDVKTDFKLFFTSHINKELWDKAKWSGTGFAITPDAPPILGLAFKNELAAAEIFENWRQRLGKRDIYGELRVSIITLNDSPNYKVHICSNIENIIKRYSELDIDADGNLLMMISRINGMEPKSLDNLNAFKKQYQEHGKCLLAPAIMKDAPAEPKFLFNLGIEKNDIVFRTENDISKDPNEPVDMDFIVLDEQQRLQHKDRKNRRLNTAQININKRSILT